MGRAVFRQTLLMAFVGGAFALLAMACTSRSKPTTSIAETTSDEPVINEVYVSPIGEALGVAQDEAAAAFDAYVNDAEELARICIAEVGFDYTRSSGEQAAYEMAWNGQTTQGLTAEEAQEQLFGSGVGEALEGSFRDLGYSTAENPGAVYNRLLPLLFNQVQFELETAFVETHADQLALLATGDA